MKLLFEKLKLSLQRRTKATQNKKSFAAWAAKDYRSHIDFRFAPFQYDDYELCSHAWLCGLEVKRYEAGVKSLSVRGMRLRNNLFTKEQCIKNGHLPYDLYVHHIEDIRHKAAIANQQP